MTASPAAARTLTASGFIPYRTLSGVRLSPDATRVAAVVTETFTDPGQAGPSSEVLVVAVDTGDWRPITAGGRVESGPSWSPDGATLAFLSDAGDSGALALYLWDERRGEARPLQASTAPTGSELAPQLHTISPNAPVWSDDGSELAFMAPAGAPESSLVYGAAAMGVGPWPQRNGICVVRVADGRTVDFVTPDRHVWEFDRSPDGRRFAAVASEGAGEDAWYGASLVVIERDDATHRVLAEPFGDLPGHAAHWKVGRQFAAPRFSPDGRQVAYISCSWSDRGIVGGDLLVVPADGGPRRNLTAGRPVSVSFAQWLDDATLLALAWWEGEQALVAIDLDTGAMDRLWREPVAIAERGQPRFSLAAGGTAAVAREDHEHPPELWLVDVTRDKVHGWRRISRLQPRDEGVAPSELRVLTWNAPDGTPIQGHLLLPQERGDEPLPLIVYPHGGPAMLHQHLFLGRVEGPYGFPLELLPASGFALLLPNPRGSLGWGVRFTEANREDLGGADVEDVLAGVDACVELGLVDPDRVGIAGWSSSGFLAAMATCVTDRFRAALVGAAYVDVRNLLGTHAPYVDMFHPGDLSSGASYDAMSPIARVHEVRTPTLVIHSESDVMLPVFQAMLWYRALQAQGVPLELAIYPRETHAIRERAHQADIGRRIVDWFRSWLCPSDAAPAA